jgi:hypothetical protein
MTNDAPVQLTLDGGESRSLPAGRTAVQLPDGTWHLPATRHFRAARADTLREAEILADCDAAALRYGTAGD